MTENSVCVSPLPEDRPGERQHESAPESLNSRPCRALCPRFLPQGPARTRQYSRPGRKLRAAFLRC